MKRTGSVIAVLVGVLMSLEVGVWTDQATGASILIHMKTSLAEDGAQICAVPNVAWAAVKAGHKVAILVDASAVASVARGVGFFRRLVGSDATVLDRATLPERERESLSQQMGVPLEQIPHDYREYFDFLKKLGVEIYGNRTMMRLYEIDPVRVSPVVTPIPLERMVQLFTSADRIIVC